MVSYPFSDSAQGVTFRDTSAVIPSYSVPTYLTVSVFLVGFNWCHFSGARVQGGIYLTLNGYRDVLRVDQQLAITDTYYPSITFRGGLFPTGIGRQLSASDRATFGR